MIPEASNNEKSAVEMMKNHFKRRIPYRPHQKYTVDSSISSQHVKVLF